LRVPAVFAAGLRSEVLLPRLTEAGFLVSVFTVDCLVTVFALDCRVSVFTVDCRVSVFTVDCRVSVFTAACLDTGFDVCLPVVAPVDLFDGALLLPADESLLLSLLPAGLYTWVLADDLLTGVLPRVRVAVWLPPVRTVLA
jgi:hypothetical protein